MKRCLTIFLVSQPTLAPQYETSKNSGGVKTRRNCVKTWHSTVPLLLIFDQSLLTCTTLLCWSFPMAIGRNVFVYGMTYQTPSTVFILNDPSVNNVCSITIVANYGTTVLVLACPAVYSRMNVNGGRQKLMLFYAIQIWNKRWRNTLTLQCFIMQTHLTILRKDQIFPFLIWNICWNDEWSP